MNPRHVQLIALYSLRYSVRSGIGLVFLFISLIFGLMVAHIMLQPAEALVEMERKRGVEMTAAEAVRQLHDKSTMAGRTTHGAVRWVLGASDIENIEDADAQARAEEDLEAWTRHLLEDHPAMLSAILLVLLWGWPFVTSLGAFNLFSGDVQSRGIRYHLMRATRSSIFYGRVIGMVLSQALVLLLLVLTIVVYMGLKLKAYEWGPLLTWGAAGVLMLTVLSVPYIALCAWISAAIDSPIASLVVVSLVIGGVPLVSLLGSYSFEQIALVEYLLPWGIQNHLHHPSLALSLGTGLLCLGYAAVFLYFGHRHFNRRDL